MFASCMEALHHLLNAEDDAFHQVSFCPLANCLKIDFLTWQYILLTENLSSYVSC